MDAQDTLLTSPDLPRRLAQYELLEQVGAGAMGVVWRARDVDLQRVVAIKLLHAAGEAAARSAELEERFLREARAAAQLVHPNVAVVYQVGQAELSRFIAMEWLDGGDLGAWVKRQGPLPWREAARAVADAASGLAAAHAAGLVHRDVKPSNLMRHASGQVKLVDFGLARWHDTASDLTRSGMLLGTPAYLSPEQCRGDDALPASDQYALGCTLFYLLSGHAPFAAPQVIGLLHQHVAEPVPDLRAQVGGLPDELVHIVERAMAKQPSERFADASRMQQALEQLLDAASGPATVSMAIERPPTGPLQGHVPQEPNAFIGREAEVVALGHALAVSRLVTLVGPGGAGKTRLAAHVAHAMATQQPVWFVELSPLADGAQIVPAAVALMTLRETPGRNAEEVLIEALRDPPAMLVLDNCEHLLDAAAALARRLLDACPGLRIVATSRQALDIRDEQVLPLPPMDTGSDAADTAQLQASEAVRLFAQRAATARPGFVVDAGNVAAVAAVCRQLDGMPLAIELAAARVKVLSLAQIAGRLADMLKLLAGGPKSLEPRQQTLRALIDWSWQLLDEDERRAFERCSVFAGGFDIDAAEAVVVDDDGGDMLSRLAQLVDKSLLIAHEEGEVVRFRMLQTIRQYAADKLAVRGDGADVRRRHAAHYARLATEWSRGTRGDQAPQLLAALARERDDIHAAFDAVVEQRWFEIGAPFAIAMASHWFRQGQLSDGLARITRYIEAQPDQDASLAKLLRQAGNFAVFLGHYERARSWFKQGLAMARATGDKAMEASFRVGLGGTELKCNRLDKATVHIGNAITLARELGLRTEAEALNILASIELEQGRNEAARRHFEAAIAIHVRNQDEVAAGVVGMNLAWLELNLCRTDEAEPRLRQCLAVFERFEDEWDAAYAQVALARVAENRGQPAEARERLEAAREVLRQLGDSDFESEALDRLARLALQAGDRERAGSLAQRSLALRLALGFASAIASTLETMATIGVAGDAALAARRLGCARALRERIGVPAPPSDQARLAELQAALVARLPQDRLGAELAAGRAAEPAMLA